MEALTSPGLLDHGGMLNAFGGLRDNATVGLGVWASNLQRGARVGLVGLPTPLWWEVAASIPN